MLDLQKKKIHPVDVYVGKRLKEVRQSQKISQEDLANSVDLTFQQVQKYESAKNRISCSKLYEFAKFLNVEVQEFFNGLDSEEYPDAINKSSKEYYAHEEKKNINYGEVSRDKIKDKDLLLLMFDDISNQKVKENVLFLVESLARHY